ncbi:DNA-binding transcriptional regulator, MerR family [Mariniphaga anaerophila]|uniref:DNA-binding transcriptional regulator, MerR family n=1 Tax=Mariniphaga anaerophila TaxID=1484053 RepID=A0A1M4Y3V2_9BACT|nr:MerR family transcriptional regulator [Mariniphaga anaerophila]SHF00263.1 DNA-binding transcriptional regulator, MerR family [Mariniphaga anaerophila]
MPYKKPKIEKIFFTIGEVAEMVDVTPPTIRYWESSFDELSPKKSSKGTRLFSKEDIETVKFIHFLVKERGMTVKGVQQKLKSNRQSTIENWEIVKRLQKIKDELIAIKNEMDE